MERAIGSVPAKSQVLPAYWTVVSEPQLGVALRLSCDELGRDLCPTKAEAIQHAADRRIRELEAELARRGG